MSNVDVEGFNNSETFGQRKKINCWQFMTHYRHWINICASEYFTQGIDFGRTVSQCENGHLCMLWRMVFISISIRLKLMIIALRLL